MPANPFGLVLRRLRGLVVPEGDSDAALLARFVGQRDEAAFAALMARYGPMVLGLCRRWLGHYQDAEDVFQATFLVLARKARSIRRGGSPGSFLYGVALRLARKACAEAARRRANQTPADPPMFADPLETLTARELLQALDEELAGLPERYRAPLLLCYLQGRTQDEAARELAWSKATLRRRLARGRELLKARLVGRGLSLPSFLGGSLLVGNMVSPASAALLDATTKAALAAGTISGMTAALVEAGCQALAPGRGRVLFLILLLASAALAVTVGAAYQASKPPLPSETAGPTSANQSARTEGAPAPDAVRLAPDLALVSADADLLGSIRLARLWKGAAFESYRKLVGAQSGDLARMFGFRPEDVDRLTVFNQEPGPDALLLVTTVGPTDRKTVLAAFAPRAVARQVAGKTCYRDEEDWTGIAFLNDRTVAFGAVDVVEAFVRTGGKREGVQSAALRLAAEHDLVLSGSGAREFGIRSFARALPRAIRDAGPLFHAESAVFVADAREGNPEKGRRPELHLGATIRYDTEAAAQKALTATAVLHKAAVGAIDPLMAEWNRDGPDLVGALGPGVLAALTGLRKALGELKTERNGRELTASVDLSAGDVGTLAVAKLLFTTFASTRDGFNGNQPHLGDLAKALLAYHKEKGHLPPHAHYAVDGKTPLLSWRVLILPYLGEEAKKLYGEFKLDEPWDSEHNIRLVRRMPVVFAPKNEFKKAKTTSSKDPPAEEQEEEEESEPRGATTPFQVLFGPGTLFDGPRGRPLSDATDGPENTVLVAQAFHAVPWTKPQDLAFLPGAKLPRMGNNGGWVSSVALAFGDGEMLTLPAPGYGRRTDAGRLEWAESANFDEAPLRALITRAGGEKVDRKTLRTNMLPFVAPGARPDQKVFTPEQ
jgi:RNA polymerase sigma factor (sigma-70 family)